MADLLSEDSSSSFDGYGNENEDICLRVHSGRVARIELSTTTQSTCSLLVEKDQLASGSDMVVDIVKTKQLTTACFTFTFLSELDLSDSFYSNMLLLPYYKQPSGL